MRIKQKVWAEKEIGPLDGFLLLPTAGRVRAGMKTVCVVCRGEVTEEKFLAGFKAGQPNRIFHAACVPDSERGKAYQ